MKINWNLIRELLTVIVDNDTDKGREKAKEYAEWYGFYPDARLIEGTTSAEIKKKERQEKYEKAIEYHLDMLCDGGFISVPSVCNTRLTWKGQQLYARIHSDKVWSKVQKLAEQLDLQIEETLINRVYQDYLHGLKVYQK